jgi:hypothetical protein
MALHLYELHGTRVVFLLVVAGFIAQVLAAG